MNDSDRPPDPGQDAGTGRPDEWTPTHELVAQALHADLWTEPNDEYGPEWHHRFSWWQCVRAANLIVPALPEHHAS